MPSRARQLPFIGVACILALLLSAYALAPNRAAAAHAQIATPEVSGATHFILTATSSNTPRGATFIDNPAANNNLNALIFVTPNWNPGGKGGTYDNHPIALDYADAFNQYDVFHADQTDVPLGAAFNVLIIPKASNLVFVQTSTSSNTIGDFTLINNPATNGKPSAKVLVTQDWNPGDHNGGSVDPHNVGVWYDTGAREWAVFNEDQAPMPVDASFNVMVGAGSSGGGKAFLQTATSSNTLGDYTLINNSLTNRDANAIVFATQNWNPGGIFNGTYNNAAIGVWYDSGLNEWSVFNEGIENIPINAAFNILAFSS